MLQIGDVRDVVTAGTPTSSSSLSSSSSDESRSHHREMAAPADDDEHESAGDIDDDDNEGSDGSDRLCKNSVMISSSSMLQERLSSQHVQLESGKSELPGDAGE